ncbi:telomerase activating est1 [Trichoderma arundinaceum]|uniref:Nonsense-mediated mRNA decay factor n=1 Tax=Trichoderma arundinaceum TaxID=490622 RepID=A0A395NW52_TRIAR|nr:telomerase activating est1 [Trichoderma arundinaceum]
MASSTAPPASLTWRDAQKLRKYLARDIGKLQPGNGSGIDVSKFEAVDSLLEKFRLACVSTIFLDFDYAVSQKTEEHLWLIHTSINAEYRRILGRLKQSSHAVEKRKVEKMYNNFLRIAHKFYKGYIQRLSALYDIPELKRIAQGIELDQLVVEDKISPVSDDLQRKVLYSCHLTLVHLGDLTRYRVQARHKNSGYEGALLYYGLAHHLQPQSGFAFHQIGIINLEQGNHLDVVYHFYRALAVDSPHPNAQLNLEAEFKTVLAPNGSKSRHNASAPQDHFTMWFVKLHAFFYKGEVFHQQDELEGEVMHRLEMACRNAASPNILLKMALVNMLAHYIATAQYTENQTETSMRFYKYTLRFNVRFIHTFCKTFETELREAISSAEGLDHHLDTTETNQEKTSVIEALLPVLRVYGMWLAARRREISSLADAFGAAIPAMIQTAAKIYTLLCAEYYSLDNLKTCPYLLPEDIQILGFQPLNEEQLPEHCRAYCGEDGDRKPFSQTLEGCPSQSSERIGRILDILRCAYFLANENVFPMACTVEGSALIFEYQPTVEQPQAQPSTEQDTSQSVGVLPATDEKEPKSAKPSSHEPAMPEATTETLASDQRATSRRLLNSNNDIYEDSEMLDRATETVLDMVVPFLRPPTPQPLQPHSPEESSYGMHTSTANDVFGPFKTELSPTTSIALGKFEPLPWAWFGTPNPHAARDSAPSMSQDIQGNHRSTTHSPSASMMANRPLEDPFTTPDRDVSGASSRYIANEARSPPNATARRSHREQLLQAFNNGTSTPRTSYLGHWSQNSNASRPPAAVMAMQEPQDYRAMPNSSDISAFSHPSSLYQGTQANGLRYNTQFTAEQGRVFRNSLLRETNQALNSHFQIDKTTSNYNNAVMRSAYQDSH